MTAPTTTGGNTPTLPDRPAADAPPTCADPPTDDATCLVVEPATPHGTSTTSYDIEKVRQRVEYEQARHRPPDADADDLDARRELVRTVLEPHFVERARKYKMTAAMRVAVALLFPPESSTDRHAAQASKGTLPQQLARAIEAAVPMRFPFKVRRPDGRRLQVTRYRGVANFVFELLTHFVYDAVANPDEIAGGPLDTGAVLEFFAGIVGIHGPGDRGARRLMNSILSNFEPPHQR